MPPVEGHVRVDSNEEGGRLAIVTIDRPPLNVLDIPTIEKLGAAIDAVARRPETVVLLLTGAGTRAFSAGVDVLDHTPDKVSRMLRSFHETIGRLSTVPAVTVAAVSGMALGGGLELAAACDLAVVAEDARLAVPEIDVGCYPPVALAHWPRRVGAKLVADLALTGRSLPAAEAKAAGLVSHVAAPGGALAAGRDLAATLLKKSPSVLRATIETLRRLDRVEENRRLLETESDYLGKLLGLEDLAEGIAAFAEKRPPRWTGR